MQIVAGIIVSALALSASAAAEGVTSRLDAVRVTMTEGGERFAPAKRAKPGETVEYRLTYRNDTDGPVTGFVALGPVPEGTAFVPGSASADRDAVLEASAPGVAWATPPLVREVRRADGTTDRVTVDPSEYDAVRWRLTAAMPAGAELGARYRVAVED